MPKLVPPIDLKKPRTIGKICDKFLGSVGFVKQTNGGQTKYIIRKQATPIKKQLNINLLLPFCTSKYNNPLDINMNHINHDSQITPVMGGVNGFI
ncbi:MAG: hypothetical protein MJ200_03010 [Mycoplasmoidaceae bacterium]|nr:hypothetical protein [Mycoplasmoidaceae bacterium]